MSVIAARGIQGSGCRSLCRRLLAWLSSILGALLFALLSWLMRSDREYRADNLPGADEDVSEDSISEQQEDDDR